MLVSEAYISSQSQAVQEKQTALYSLQRKLKSSRQALEHKELQVSLLQRKVASLEERLIEVAQKEAEWDAAIDKVRRCCVP